MKKNRGEQLSLHFEASKLGEEVSSTSDTIIRQHQGTVLSFSAFRREAGTKIAAAAVDERSLLEKALRRVRLF